VLLISCYLHCFGCYLYVLFFILGVNVMLFFEFALLIVCYLLICVVNCLLFIYVVHVLLLFHLLLLIVYYFSF